MKSNWMIGGAIGCLLCAILASNANAFPAAAPRKSADGVELPSALPERKFHVVFPLAGQILGEKPEEVGRVFNCRHSAPLLTKRTTVDLGCDWFVLNAAGADVVGLGLTDGRVSKLVLFYEIAPATKVNNIRKQIESKADKAIKATLKTTGEDKKPSLMVTFDADPIEFYLANHPTSEAVAAAMRQHVWNASMTDEQALIIGDGPGRYQAIFAPDGSPEDAKNASAIFADNTPTDIRMVFDAHNKEDAHAQALKKHKNLKELTKIPDPSAK